jgi:hypothetical protein
MVFLAVSVAVMIIDLIKGGESARAEIKINENKCEEAIKCQK